MKKALTLSLSLLTLATLTACAGRSGNTNKSGGANTTTVASNQSAQVEIVDGEYLLSNNSGRNKKYLALRLKIKNTSGSSISFSPDNIALYNDQDDKIAAEFVYFPEDGEFELLSFEQLSDGRAVTGYVLFDAEPGQTYELEFSAMNEKTYKRTQPITIKVNTDHYTDKSEEALKAAEHFVSSVFLGDEVLLGQTRLNHTGEATVSLLTSSSSDKQTDQFADTSAYREEFIKLFTEDVTAAFDDFYPTEAESRALISSYIKANVERGRVDYSIKSYTPTAAEIYIRPQTIDLSALNTDQLVQEFIAKNQTTSFANSTAANQAAEGYIFEQIPNQLNTLPLKSHDFMDREGLPIRFIKEDGKWILDDSEENYYVDYLYEAFSGYATDLFFFVFLP